MSYIHSISHCPFVSVGVQYQRIYNIIIILRGPRATTIPTATVSGNKNHEPPRLFGRSAGSTNECPVGRILYRRANTSHGVCPFDRHRREVVAREKRTPRRRVDAAV